MKKWSKNKVNENYFCVFNMYKVSFGKRCNEICKNQVSKRNYPGLVDVKLIFALTKSLTKEKNMLKRDESYLGNCKFMKQSDKIIENNSYEMLKLNQDIENIIKNKKKDFSYKDINENVYKTGREFHENYNKHNYDNLKDEIKDIINNCYVQENYKHNQICETNEQGLKDLVVGDFESNEIIYSAPITTCMKEIKISNTNEVGKYYIIKETGLLLEGSDPYANINYKSYIMNGKITTVGEFNKHGGLTKSLHSTNRFEKLVGKENLEEIKKKGLENFMAENGKDLKIEGIIRKMKDVD